MEENHDCYLDYPGLHAPGDFSSIFEGVPDDTGDIAPEEGATTNIPGKLKESVFPYSGREIDWEDRLPSDEDMDLSSPQTEDDFMVLRGLSGAETIEKYVTTEILISSS